MCECVAKAATKMEMGAFSLHASEYEPAQALRGFFSKNDMGIVIKDYLTS